MGSCRQPWQGRDSRAELRSRLPPESLGFRGEVFPWNSRGFGYPQLPQEPSQDLGERQQRCHSQVPNEVL